MKTNDKIEALLAKTYEGPATGWVDRMAELCRNAGADRNFMSWINWNGSPRSVADTVVRNMENLDLEQSFLKFLAEETDK